MKSFEEEINLLTAGQGVIRSPTYQREMEKRVANRILKSENEDIREKVNEEIDSEPSAHEIQQFMQVQAAQSQAGGTGNSGDKPKKTEGDAKPKPAPKARPERKEDG